MSDDAQTAVIEPPASVGDADAPTSCPYAWHPRARSGAAPACGWQMWQREVLRHMIGLLDAEQRGCRMTRGVLALLLPAIYGALPEGTPGIAARFLLAEAWAGFGVPPTITVKAKALPGRLWEPHERGDRFDALPVFVPDGESLSCIDVLAWPGDEPTKVHQRVGLIEGLNVELLTGEETPVRLHRTPASWAAAGAARGVWLEKPRLHRTALIDLAGVEPAQGWGSHIVCDDRAHAEEIHALLRRAEKRTYPEVGFTRRASKAA